MVWPSSRKGITKGWGKRKHGFRKIVYIGKIQGEHGKCGWIRKLFMFLFLQYIFDFVIWNIHEAIHPLRGQLLYLLCLNPILWLSLSVHACAIRTYLHLCMLKLLLWIMEWFGFTLVCCESLLLPTVIYIPQNKNIYAWCIIVFKHKIFCLRNWHPQLMILHFVVGFTILLLGLV